jgi:beta-phosphoglucomutase
MQVARYGQVVKFGAVFDLDGVLARTGFLQDTAWLHASNWGAADLRRLAARVSSSAALARGLFPNAEAGQVIAEKNRIYDELLRRQLLEDPGSLKVAGACEFVGQLFDESVSLALNTSSPAKQAKLILETFGILGHFSIVLTAEDILNHKPDPEGYLLAAERLKLHPRLCVGFEDSIPGLQSLHLAGYGVVVAVGSILSEAQVRAKCPWIARYIPDFTNFTPREASRLLTPGQV